MSVICLSGIFTENMPVLKLVFQLPLTWFLSWFKKASLQYIFTPSHFPQRHHMIEVVGLAPMHHILLSMAGTKEQRDGGGSIPTAWLCLVRAPMQQYCAIFLQGACLLFGMCRCTHCQPNNFLGGWPLISRERSVHEWCHIGATVKNRDTY